MPSVARRIYAALADRLAAIDGSGDMVNNLAGSVFRFKPSHDAEVEAVPAVFVFRREGGEERSGTPDDLCIDRTVVFDVLGIVGAGAESGDAAEDLLADIERALEIKTDLYLSSGGVNLLIEPLTLLPSEFSLGGDGSKVESVAVGVRCRYPHIYGDPNYVPL